MINLSYASQSPEAVALTVYEGLVVDGAVLIKNVPTDPDNAALVCLANALGRISKHGIKKRRSNIENEFIHRIEPRAVPLKDHYGFEILSTSEKSFPCHTDDFFSEYPVNVVLFHCWRPDIEGGETSLVYAKDIVQQLSAADRVALRSPMFSCPFGKASLLGGPVAAPTIRYSRYELSKYAQTLDAPLSAETLELLDRLDAAVARCRIRFTMDEGDCVVVRNDKLLHGRSALSPESNRLLKRVRLHANFDEQTHSAV